MIDVRIQSGDFDPGRQLARLGEPRKAAVTGFVGRIEAGEDVREVHVDHHAVLARSELQAIAGEAMERWPLDGVILIHRHGRLSPGDRVMFAGVVASDVARASEATAWLVDQLRARAPFWRKDLLADGSVRWWEPRRSA